MCRADQQASLRQARIFFDELEFVKCVQVADAAPADPDRARERAELELLAGLCEANLGRLDAAQSRFRVALRLAPELTIPEGTSPKIEARFALARRQAEEREEAAPVVEPAPEPVQAPVTAPVVASPEAQTPLPPPPPPLKPAKAPQTRFAAIALGLAAVAATGTALYFGVTASSLATRANTATFDSDNIRLGQQAREHALGANLLFGGAALAGGAAAVAFVFDLP